PLHLDHTFRVPPPTVTHPLSLHDALPISAPMESRRNSPQQKAWLFAGRADEGRAPPVPSRCQFLPGEERSRRCLPPCRWSFARGDRKSTRLNSSHVKISYAVFCLKKKTTR